MQQSNSAADFIDFLRSVESRLRHANGGRFRTEIRSDRSTRHVLVRVYCPELFEFAFFPNELASHRADDHAGVNWITALKSILKTGHGRIEVEVSKSGRRIKTSWDVITSHRNLQ